MRLSGGALSAPRLLILESLSRAQDQIIIIGQAQKTTLQGARFSKVFPTPLAGRRRRCRIYEEPLLRR